MSEFYHHERQNSNVIKILFDVLRIVCKNADMIYVKNEKSSAVVNIENTDNNNPYTAIGSKAFLSCKNVCEIKLPDTICEIGDWAFAHMKELKKIVIPAKNVAIGREAFLDCSNLEEIVIYPDETGNKGLSCLLASCITILNCYQLLDFKLAAENNQEWCERYDAELFRYIMQPDDRDFKFYIVGWFDDECEEEQLERHIEKTRTEKLLLCFLRLKYDLHLNEKMKERLIQYIKSCFEYSGKDSAWEIFRDKLSDDIEYVKIAANHDLLTSELKSELIKYINGRNGNPEIVAYLLSLNEDKKSLDQLFEL